jgi:predicted RNA-binding Zn-ribbon protein involved in translation (DUF1610 family)
MDKKVAAPAAPPIPTVATNKTFPCSSCGAKLQFQPGLRALKCPYCGAETEIPQADAPAQEGALEHQDYDSVVAVAPEEPPIPVQKVKCGSCAGETTFAPNVTSDKCSFCGNPAISTTAYAARKIKPQALAPFDIKERDARDRFTNWVKGLWFAPSALQKAARIDKGLRGYYIPFFTYDATTFSDYTGERGTVYYVDVEVTVNGKTETRREERVRWTYVSGEVQVDFDNIPIVSSKTLPVQYAEDLEPWKFESLVPYSESYIAGFVVEAYQQGLQPGFARACEKMVPVIRQAIERDIGGDRQRIGSVNTKYQDKAFRHLLLPIWLSAYNYSGKTYRFLVNGQTGLVKGERPWSWVKITFAVIAALVLAYGGYRLYQSQQAPPQQQQQLDQQ